MVCTYVNTIQTNQIVQTIQCEPLVNSCHPKSTIFSKFLCNLPEVSLLFDE